MNFEFETESDEGRKVYRIEREIRRKNSLQKAAERADEWRKSELGGVCAGDA